MEPPKLWLNVRCWKRKTKKPFAVTGVVLSQLTSKTDHRQGDETFCFLKKLSEMTMLTTFYRAKDAHLWVTLISLKTENLIKRWSNVWYWKRTTEKPKNVVHDIPFFTWVEAKITPRVLVSNRCTLTGDLPTIKRSRKAENPRTYCVFSRRWKRKWVLAY
jgi:hypothetical protein